MNQRACAGGCGRTADALDCPPGWQCHVCEAQRFIETDGDAYKDRERETARRRATPAKGRPGKEGT